MGVTEGVNVLVEREMFVVVEKVAEKGGASFPALPTVCTLPLTNSTPPPSHQCYFCTF